MVSRLASGGVVWQGHRHALLFPMYLQQAAPLSRCGHGRAIKAQVSPGGGLSEHKFPPGPTWGDPLIRDLDSV